MSTFRNAITSLENKSAYIMLGESLLLATRLNIYDDLVEVELASPIADGAKKIYVHINNIILADKA